VSSGEGGIFFTGGQYLDTETWTLRDGDVLVLGDRITAVGERLHPPHTVRTISLTNSVLIPGLVNGHTHAHNNLIKGKGELWTLEVFLSLGPALNANRTPEDHYLSAALGAMEMVKSGITSAYDLFIEYPAPTPEGTAAVIQAYRDVGLRSIVAPAVADRTILDVLPLSDEARFPVRTQTSVKEILDVLLQVLKSHGRDPRDLVRVAIAPTIPMLCTDSFLEHSRELAREFDCGIHTHLAESRFQAVASRRMYGHSLTTHLDRMGLLGPDVVAAHAVWVTREEIDLIASTGTKIVHNPASNLKLGSGIAHIHDLRRQGVQVAIGTDGCGSSDNLNMFEAMRFASLSSRALGETNSDSWLTATDALDMAISNGASVMGLSSCLGKIKPGYLADLVVLDLESSYLTPLNNLARQLTYCETGQSVKSVIVAGKSVFEDGHLVNVDESQIKQAARESSSRLSQLNRDRLEVAGHRARRIEEACYEACRKEGGDWNPGA
jgi:5-methylthioadenosine/S-adenosylhomocysteine deaminase